VAKAVTIADFGARRRSRAIAGKALLRQASAPGDHGQLADVPTPAGPTPRQIRTPAQATLLPVIEINRRPT
jgi:hypothetical protein